MASKPRFTGLWAPTSAPVGAAGTKPSVNASALGRSTAADAAQRELREERERAAQRKLQLLAAREQQAEPGAGDERGEDDRRRQRKAERKARKAAKKARRAAKKERKAKRRERRSSSSSSSGSDGEG
ncbi:hypothetical protein EMIHUDRAFT_251896 [Emiliania huxleyi CCMP1516]|uniref:Uncharacterized protein n=2 Tax=Emiliania huxleyi TaxID=2903 RepID=A0A0D3KQ24_EMIH1|nr:hypothetical protein EMIHUDRAFT_251896 [Emiliania huxleyi CCMP1516]EOD37859.1 hypothetical protein EMIHUDRAFT_251896 [Emiliania huxleyi CCMP1516]|eukprot:XP_005790288.1 hypothetical protein EMIHUDRAFT_251896 [Emiliania huxleyi CCMP1516]